MRTPALSGSDAIMMTIPPIAYVPPTATFGRRFGIVLAVVCTLHVGTLTALVFRSSAPPAHAPVLVLAAALITPASVPIENVSRAVATTSRPVKEPLHGTTAASRTSHRLTPVPAIRHTQPRPAAPEATPANAPATEVPSSPARADVPQNSPPAQSQPAIAAPRTTPAVSRLDCAIVKPAYPLLSRRLHESGTAVVQLVIDEQGTIESARVASSSGYPRLDDAARQAVLASTCSPYLKDGTAKRASTSVPFTFSLDN
jgi:periplasmic protein TonB